jgi:hypothetical protein
MLFAIEHAAPEDSVTVFLQIYAFSESFSLSVAYNLLCEILQRKLRDNPSH